MMLQSLVARSPISSSPPPNSAMKAKRSIAGGDDDIDIDIDIDIDNDIDIDDQSSRKKKKQQRRANFNSCDEATLISTAAAEEEEEEEDLVVLSLTESESSSSTAGLRLLGLLLECAECVAMDNLDHATDLLPEISQLSSPFGSSPERVAAYFAQALQGRIVSSCLGTYSPLLAPPPPPPPPLNSNNNRNNTNNNNNNNSMMMLKALSLSHTQKMFNALQSYNSISPLIKFSHFTANQAIFQALEGEDRVHLIDLDIMQGLQWPGLFHILASASSSASASSASSSSTSCTTISRRRKKIKSIRITGIGSSMDLLQATGRRLADFANSLGLPFEFQAFEGKVGNITDVVSQLGVRVGETRVVHWMHHCLYDITGSDLGTLRLLNLLRPKLITMVEQDLSHGGGGGSSCFLGRFVEALHYYSALFDALGDTININGDQDIQRHTVEQQLFGCEIRNIVAVGGPKRTGEVKVERWGDELRRTGFRPVSLSGNPAAQASLLLGMYPWKGYTLVEENGCLKLGWKDLPLLTASSWQPSDY